MAATVLVAASLVLPPAAHAQTKQLTLFMRVGSVIYYGNLFDTDVQSVQNDAYTFTNAPTAVSDRRGRMWLASMTAQGDLAYTVSADNGLTSWQKWQAVPGTVRGGVCTSRCYTWLTARSPAISSWGSGRLELFAFAKRSDDAIALMHTWGDNGQWSQRWESLGTGSFSGSPSAVSWGPGRTDVFAQSGAGPDLAHKSFDNGNWSGWESLGGIITASPSATSMGPGHLDIYVRGPDGGLWHQWFWDSNWSGWESLGKPRGHTTDQDPKGPVAAAAGWNVLDVFVWSNIALYQRQYVFGWQDYVDIGGDFNWNGPIAAVYWER